MTGTRDTIDGPTASRQNAGIFRADVHPLETPARPSLVVVGKPCGAAPQLPATPLPATTRTAHRQPPPPPSPCTEEEEAFRHSGWAKRRAAVAAGLARTNAPASRRECFACCGSQCHVMYHRVTGEARVEASYCHDRFCAPCAAARANVIADNVARQITHGPKLHIVLTLKSTTAPLADHSEGSTDHSDACDGARSGSLASPAEQPSSKSPAPRPQISGTRTSTASWTPTGFPKPTSKQPGLKPRQTPTSFG